MTDEINVMKNIQGNVLKHAIEVDDDFSKYCTAVYPVTQCPCGAYQLEWDDKTILEWADTCSTSRETS